MQNTVAIEVSGKTYTASYAVTKKIITVSTGLGSKSTQLGSLPPEHLARILLRELIQEGKA